MLKTTFDSKVALGSPFTLLLVHDQTIAATDVLRELWVAIFSFEKRFSRFLPDSELTQFNLAAGRRQPVSPAFLELLQAAKQMALATDDLYNPFILPALQRVGYTKSLVAAHADDVQIDFSDRAVVSAEKLVLGADWAEIPYNTALDMGGCGKGFLGDKLAEIMKKYAVTGYWFSLGGDIICRGTDEAGAPWIVHIADTPEQIRSCRYHFVAPADGYLAVATSSTKMRAGVAAGKPWHHILDPRTGLSTSTDVTRASVAAATLLEADVLASCVIIVGSQQTPGYLEKHRATGSLILADNDLGTPIVSGICQPHV